MDTPGVLVAFDGSRRAEVALEEAVEIARDSAKQLSVLVLVATEQPSRCCNRQTTLWNREMGRLSAEHALQARTLLPQDIRAAVVVREGCGKGAVTRAAAELGCTTIVEAGRRGRIRRRVLSA